MTSHTAVSLGVPPVLADVVAIAAGFQHSLALRGDGKVFAWGIGSQTNVPASLSNVVAIAAGKNLSLALCSDGTVAAWGQNSYGQLGDNSTTDRSAPVAVNTTGVLAGKTVVAIAAGGKRSLALRRDGVVFAWGSKSNVSPDGQTASISSVPIEVQGLADMVGIAAGGVRNNHAHGARRVALRGDGQRRDQRCSGKQEAGAQIHDDPNLTASGAWLSGPGAALGLDNGPGPNGGHGGSSQGIPRGGTGGISNAIAKAARSFGAEIRTEAPVARILIEDGKARGVVLATGGIGKAWKFTSNSWEYSGDGIGLAYDAGAELMDMEFVQFHPTGMVWPPSVRGILVTESVRGDGGTLKNSTGERFMFNYIPDFFKGETADNEAEADRWLRKLDPQVFPLRRVREGLVLDYIARHRKEIAQADRYPDVRRRSVIELGERCGYWPEHAQQVTKLALSIFDQTRGAHGLGDRERRGPGGAAIMARAQRRPPRAPPGSRRRPALRRRSRRAATRRPRSPQGGPPRIAAAPPRRPSAHPW